MQSIFPSISMSELQRNAKAALSRIQDYAVIQSHGHDRGMVLHPELGRMLIESGMLGVLKEQLERRRKGFGEDPAMTQAIDSLIGNVLSALSKK
jgi:hypothetical protein